MGQRERMASYQGVATSIAKLHKDMQYIDEGDYSSIIIMQDDGVHSSLRYIHHAYVDTVMKVTHDIFVQFPHS